MIFYYKQIIYTACIFLSATSGLFRKAHRKHFFTTICATFKDSTRTAPVVTTQAKYSILVLYILKNLNFE